MRPSTIDSLPDEVRDALRSWLRDPSVTQVEARDRANALLASVDEWRGRPLSSSAVNRYDIRMRKAGARLQESQAAANAWTAKIGDRSTGETSRLITEMLRTLVFELTLHLQENEWAAESVPLVAAQIEKLSLTATRLERAALESLKHEREVRKQAAEDLATQAGKDKAGAPLTVERLREIVREIYGV